jgi:hypothetical protein
VRPSPGSPQCRSLCPTSVARWHANLAPLDQPPFGPPTGRNLKLDYDPRQGIDDRGFGNFLEVKARGSCLMLPSRPSRSLRSDAERQHLTVVSERGRVRATSISALMVPGRRVKTRMRSSAIASSIECVTRTQVLRSLPYADHFTLRQETVLRVKRRERLVHRGTFGSRQRTGTDTRWRMPPESGAIARSKPLRPTRANTPSRSGCARRP